MGLPGFPLARGQPNFLAAQRTYGDYELSRPGTKGDLPC